MTHDSNQRFDPDKHKYMYRSIAGTIIAVYAISEDIVYSI